MDGSSLSLAPLLLLLLALLHSSPPLHAADPDPLQDFCVADLSSTVKVNGFVCRDPALATGDDFASSVMSKPGNASNPLGYTATRATVSNFPGLNTHGISSTRGDFAVGGVNPPHVHPRASELIYVQKGVLYAGFVSTENKLFAKTLHKGELFIIPQGLIHFQLNVGTTPAVTIVAFNSQNPGTSRVAKAVFASNPAIEEAVLMRSFQISHGEVEHLRKVIAKT